MTTALDNISKSIAPELRMLNERILLALSSPNAMMNSIIQEYLQRKGKQIRPIVVLLCARLFTEEVTAKVIAAAAAVEMLHNASLIHDDVIDESKLRRGQPTINGIWDNHIAVLVGDYFTSTALQLANETAHLGIVNALASLGRLLSLGELDQIYNARYHRLSEEAYMHTIGSKTASLFVACAEMGAYSVGVTDDDPRLTAVKNFAEKLGLCFQITDDIFDYTSTVSEIGKPTGGNDLREGKITLPLLSVLLREDAPRHAQMLALSRKEQLSDEDVLTLITYAVENGGIAYAQATMQRLATEAKAELTAAFGADNAMCGTLSSLLDYVVARSK